MLQLLITCHANICRSAFGAAWLNARFSTNAELQVLSAGFSAETGHQMCTLASRKLGNTSPGTHRSQRINRDLAFSSDLIITMGKEQNDMISTAWPSLRQHVYSLPEAAALYQEACHSGLLSGGVWGPDVPEILYSLRGLVEVPSLPDPRGRWHKPLPPGVIADGHGLGHSAHQKVLEQVRKYCDLLVQ